MSKLFEFGLFATLLLSPSISEATAQALAAIEIEAERDQEAERSLIVVVPKTESNLPVSDLIAALRGQLGELDISVVVSSESFREAPIQGSEQQHGRDVLAFVWLVEHEGTLTVHFYEAAGASLRERRIPVSGTDAVSLEEVAIIVRSAVGALLERAEKQEEAPPAAQEKLAPTPINTRAVSEETAASPLLFGLGLSVSRYASTTSYQAGVRGVMGLRPVNSFWEVGVAYTYMPALTVEDPVVTMTLARHPIELYIASDYRLPVARLFLGGSLGLMLDPIKRDTIATDSSATATDDQWRTSWATSLQFRAGWYATSLLRIFASAGAEILLQSHKEVIGGNEARVLVSPLAVRPALFVGISINIP